VSGCSSRAGELQARREASAVSWRKGKAEFVVIVDAQDLENFSTVESC
jgi:hypothetical protein